ncbi:MAG: alpha/beta hydrolase-fold protein [Phycisphaerales bacterium]
MIRTLVVLVLWLFGGGTALAEPLVRVVIDPRIEAQGPYSGRLVVSLLSADSPLHRGNAAINAPFFRHPQPMFGTDIVGLEPGEAVDLNDDWTWFPEPPSELNPGYYRAAAWLDRSREDSRWRREAGNLYSDEFTLRVFEDGRIETLTIVLANVVDPEPMEPQEGVTLIEAGGLRAAVVEPIGYDPNERYATIYQVPGFGGDHRSAVWDARSRTRLRMDDPRRQLLSRCFVVHLDPEGPNGHHLFADSANNGPMGAALVDELIPAIERAYPAMRRDARDRIVTGHSSGGWSSLWLGLTYPETFGAVWSSAPDPVDFRAFQRGNFYEDDNAYRRDDAPVISYRSEGMDLMSVRQENRMEEVMGPGNTSAQQWDSWWAVFCPMGEDGEPMAPFDAETGAIDREVVRAMAPYDIGAMVRAQPGKYLPLFRERVRLIVGDADNYFLNEAVALLKADLARLSEERGEPDAGDGITIVPGADHGSIFRSDARSAWPREMLQHLGRRRDG